jgi:hypothetical protein
MQGIIINPENTFVVDVSTAIEIRINFELEEDIKKFAVTSAPLKNKFTFFRLCNFVLENVEYCRKKQFKLLLYINKQNKTYINMLKTICKPLSICLIIAEEPFKAFEHNIKNFSFITSISEQFQIRNTKKTIKETKEEFHRIFSKWFGEHEKDTYNKKLYISCINSCPILGKIDNDFILKEILFYHAKYEFNELCLSDTMGTINYDDFEYIIDSCLLFGVPPSKISLHFHCSNNNYENLEKIIHYCFTKNLNKFDISMLDTGGCPVTMNSEQLSPNLSYDMFYKIIDKYIEKKLL